MNGCSLWRVEQHNGCDTLQHRIFASVEIIFHKFPTVLVVSVSATSYKVQAWKLPVLFHQIVHSGHEHVTLRNAIDILWVPK
jgi:hypothetical protein